MRKCTSVVAALLCCLVSVSALAAGAETGRSEQVPVVVTAAPAVPPENADAGVTVRPDVSYVQGVKQCTGDLYFPPDYKRNSAQYPVVMVVHGGAWILGSKIDPGEKDIARRLAAKGYITYSVNYRLLQDGGVYPNAVYDVRDALSFLVSHASELRIDTQRIGVYGGSAGSLLALLVAYVPSDSAVFKAPHYPGVVIPKPKAAVAYGAISDMRKLEYTWVIKFMDDTPWHGTDDYAHASPVTWAQSAVPTLCVHGDHDETVPIEQSKELVAALKAAGVESQLLVIPKSRHVFHEEPGPQREMAFEKLLNFFDSHLKQ